MIGMGFAPQAPPTARGEFAVGPGISVWNFAHRGPNALLKRGSCRRQRQVEFGQFAGEIGFELTDCLFQDRRIRIFRLDMLPSHGNDVSAAFFDRYRSDQRIQRDSSHDASSRNCAGPVNRRFRPALFIREVETVEQRVYFQRQRRVGLHRRRRRYDAPITEGFDRSAGPGLPAQRGPPGRRGRSAWRRNRSCPRTDIVPGRPSWRWP